MNSRKFEAIMRLTGNGLHGQNSFSSGKVKSGNKGWLKHQDKKTKHLARIGKARKASAILAKGMI